MNQSSLTISPALLSSATGAPPKLPASDHHAESVRRLPAAAQASFHRFAAAGEVGELDAVVFAILTHFIPHPPARPLAVFPGGTLLIEELGFDSLAIAEVVFFTEDLLGIRIANEEIGQTRTLDDLRNFVRRKVSARAAR